MSVAALTAFLAIIPFFVLRPVWFLTTITMLSWPVRQMHIYHRHGQLKAVFCSSFKAVSFESYKQVKNMSSWLWSIVKATNKGFARKWSILSTLRSSPSGWRKIWENFSGEPRDARKIFVIGVDFVEILGENGVEMHGKLCQNLDFRVEVLGFRVFRARF